ncbi:MAG: hypothetical protein IPJ61_02005 [Tessaracoccus sp.]|uniref:hypothetical protein n=1 Tax=Tessaracoccus sp. TaxID=1971211 RepID=UPI001EC4DF14|nr:hypothetical protein [Tessaracoccus sp.]MBK7819864.1 hypothetical protein [Tessaracoccus sp.]
MNTSRFGLAVLAAGLALGLAPLAAVADDILPPDGVAPVVGMAHDGEALWLAGASANDGIVVKAETGDEVRFNATPQSVQALAWSEDKLWVADFGDADAARDHVVAYRLTSTEPGQTTYNAFDFRYQDGPRDAKAFLISGRGRVYVVTSGDNPGIYRSSLNLSRESMNTLVRVTAAPEGVTDGVFLADGSTMALRTAKGIEYIDAFSWDTVVTDTIDGAPEGESIARGAADEIFVGGNPAIRTTAKPPADTTTTVTPSPEPEASPSESPSGSSSPTSTATAPADDDVAGGAQPSRRGTIIALALAGVLALAAGAVAFFVRK